MATKYPRWLFADAVRAGTPRGPSDHTLTLAVDLVAGRWQVEDPCGAWARAGLPALGDAMTRRVHAHVRDDHHVSLVHAGVVTGPSGAVVLPGRSGAGKSSLVAECVRRGAGYLTDELVAVERDGAVRGGGMPLNLKAGARQILAWVQADGPLPARGPGSR